MRISDKKLLHDLKVLRHGGDDAVHLFLEMGKQCFDKGGTECLHNWVSVASPALPEADRHVVLTSVMRVLFDETRVVLSEPELAHSTLH